VPKYNEALRRVAHDAGIRAIDVQRAFEGRRDLFFDDCHFTEEGRRIMAELLYRELQPLVPKDTS
jgi:lysophospholipase L1-like esterase